MLFVKSFDHKQVRKYMATLHSMFESLSVTINNKQVKIPLITAQGERMRNLSDGKSKFSLPRGGIRFESFEPNSDKTCHAKIRKYAPNGKMATFNEISTQYKFTIEYAFKTTDDAYEAIEQIIPRMYPSVDVRIVDNELHETIRDIKVYIESWDIADNYDGDGEESQLTTLTLNIALDGHLYHYIADEQGGNRIEEILIDLSIIDTDEEHKPWIRITEDTNNE